MNFCLTCLILKGTTRAEEFESVMKAYLTAGVPLRYQRINDVIGAAESAILEADRRAPYRYRYQKLILNQVARRVYFQIAGPYEDMKREENGDIEYEFDGSKRT